MNKVFIDSIKRRLEILIDKSIRCNQAYETLLQILDFQYKHNDLINIAPAFFSTVKQTCITTIFIELAGLFCEKERNESVIHLLKDVEMNISQCEDHGVYIHVLQHLTDKSLKSIYFDSLENMVKFCLNLRNDNNTIYTQVKIQRDKYYAHFDKYTLSHLDALWKNYRVTYSNIETLLVLNFNLCNALNSYFNDATTIPLAIGYDDFNSVLFYLEKGYHSQDLRK